MLLEGVPRIPRNTDLRPNTVVAMADSSVQAMLMLMIEEQQAVFIL